MAENLLSLYAQTARGLGNPQNALANRMADDEAMANYLAMQPQQPVRNGLDRDALLPWAYEVKDGQRSPSGQFAVPQLGVDVWNAIKSVGSAPLTAPYNPAERDSMIEHAGAVVGPMAGVGIARGAMAPRGGSELGIFGGRLARTADRSKLAAAEWADKTGVPREQIWNDTGWFKGVDGQWRFEIPDQGATFSEKKGFFGGVKDAPLSDRLNHPELAAAYPNVAQIPTKSFGGFADAYYQLPAAARAEEIGYSKYLANDEGKRSALLHEVQHAVQNREGFTDGSSPFGKEYTDHIYPRLAGEVEARAVEARRNLTPEERAARPPWLDYDVPEANQIVTMGNNGPQYSLPDQPGIRAYHGSPHDFDRFSLDKIGTGEGAQAYGHGLYFAEREGVAKSYRDKLEKKTFDVIVRSGDADTQINFGGLGKTPPVVVDAARAWFKNGGDIDKAIASFVGDKDQFNIRIGQQLAKWKQEGAQLIGEADVPGRMYEVSIKASPEDFLDWDKPVSQQPDKVKQAVNNLFTPTLEKGDGVWRVKVGDNPVETTRTQWGAQRAAGRISPEIPDTVSDLRAHFKSQDELTKRLREAGIPGIKYLDQGSRGKGDGSRNYVVFDDALVEILRKYGLLPPAVAGAAAASNPDQAQARQ